MSQPTSILLRLRGALPLRAALLLFTAAAVGCGGDDAPGGPGGGPGGPPGGGGFPGGPGGGPATAVPVEVAEVELGEIAAFIETNGTLEAEREVDIVARTGGPLVQILTEEGRYVRAGDVLAQIDETELRAQVEISRVALNQAQVAYDRAKASLENQVVSQEVHDTALSTLESAAAQLEGNEILLGYARIQAPFAGLIIERAVKQGETITNGQRLFRISDFDPLLCQIAVPERDLTRLSIGQEAFIEVEAFPGEEFQGRVLRISPVVDAATGTIRVTIEVNRQGRLSPGMFATVRLVTDVKTNALILPKRALSLESLADEVFVVEDGVANRRAITLGYEEEERVEVTSGLAAGDRVIVVGQDGLTDATPVQIFAGPGAEEAAPRTTAAAAAPDPARLEAMRERMRARGMSDEQIEERIASFGAGGGPPGRPAGAGRPAAGGAPPAARPGGPPSQAPAGASPPADPAPSAAEPETPAARPMAAARPGRPPGGGPGGGGGAPDFEDLPPETQDAIRERLRSMGLSEEQIAARIEQGWGAGPPGGAGELTPEAEAALRARLEERGLPPEEIERIIARRRGGQP